VLNAAAAMALCMWILGRASRTWNKVAYEAPSPSLIGNDATTP